MKLAYKTLATYFDQALPSVEEVAEAFTFHAFEIDGIENEVLDIKVLPNRAPDCSSELGIARELSAILDMSLKKDYLAVNLGKTEVKTSFTQINGILGANFSKEEILDVFRRLCFGVTADGDTLIVTAPQERTDIEIPEDVAEEVGQILGYDRVLPAELSAVTVEPDQMRFQGIERMKDELVAKGYIEVSTQSFTKKGDIKLANPMDKSKPFLRTSLEENLKNALELAKKSAPLVLGPNAEPKLFEVGAVFPKRGEYLELRMSEPVKDWGHDKTADNLSTANLEEYGKDYSPKKYTLSAYKPFSVYPFITRDIAFWAPADVDEGFTKSLIKENAGEIMVRIDQFDRFEKEGRISLAYRLIFQAMDRTLTDDEVNNIMQEISSVLISKGFEIR